MRQTKIVDDGHGVEVALANGTTARFHALWLRDNSNAADTVDPYSGQKLLTVADLSPDVRVDGVALDADGALRVSFSDGASDALFSVDWLTKRAAPAAHDSSSLPEHVQCFDQSLDLTQVTFTFDEVRASRSVERRWLEATRRYGFSRLRGLPQAPGAVETVVSLFGYVRETNYGRTFQVRAEVSPINLASSRLGLQVHTDNPYREPVPTLQLLHCIENDAAGGDSVVVDGFRAAQALRAQDPKSFQCLLDTPVRFRFTSADAALEATRPLIALDAHGRIASVCFNNRSMGPASVSYERTNEFYHAYRRFADLLQADEGRVGFKLAPGELFMVDNRRVLHGRTAYESRGRRHLEGCYADVDSLASRLRVLERDDEAATL